jgi:hypothetical protein
MQSTSVQAPPVGRPPVPRAQRSTPLDITIKCLCGVGALFLVWQSWTMVAWVQNAHRIKPTGGHGTNWWAAHTLEALVCLVCLPGLVHMVRGCRQERRLLTFDVLFGVTALTMFWSDLGICFYQPILVFSSNFVNLNSPMANMPGVVNPNLDTQPDPLLLLCPIYLFGLIALGLGIRRWLYPCVRRMRPGIGNFGLFWVLIAVGTVATLVFEIPAIALRLWAYPGAPPAVSIPLGNGYFYPFPELAAGAVFFAIPLALWTMRDDRGQTFIERGTSTLRGWRQTAITFLALYGFMQAAIWGASVLDVVYGPYVHNWDEMPAYLVNNACDTAGFTGTEYGACPGSPGFQLPMKPMP